MDATYIVFFISLIFIIGPIFCLIYGLSLMKNNAIIVDEHEIILKRLLRTDILVSVHDINQFEFRTVRFRRGYDFTFHIHTDLKSYSCNIGRFPKSELKNGISKFAEKYGLEVITEAYVGGQLL